MRIVRSGAKRVSMRNVARNRRGGIDPFLGKLSYLISKSADRSKRIWICIVIRKPQQSVSSEETRKTDQTARKTIGKTMPGKIAD